MRMTSQEAQGTRPCFGKVCELKSLSERAVNEGGGDIEVILTVQEAYKLPIVHLPDWKVRRLNAT